MRSVVRTVLLVATAEQNGGAVEFALVVIFVKCHHIIDVGMIFDPSGGIIFIDVAVARTVRGFVAVSGKVGVCAYGFIFAVGSGIAPGTAHLTIDHGCGVGARRGDSGA